jgi:nucleoside-diphosphate-sugar epimerase
VIAVTGANGYVGGRILASLRSEGLDAIALVRRPGPDDPGARRYALGESLQQGALDGVDTVVHAAYDLSQRGRRAREVNVAGSMALLDGMHARRGRVVLISSLSAFAGAPSVYGQSKLALERAVLERDGVALRPGLVFGVRAGGLFGSMLATLSRRGLAPLIGGGRQRLFVTHDLALCRLVARIARGAEDAGPLFAAHELPTSLRAIAAQIAQASGHGLTALPLPAPLVALGLRAGEAARLPLPFRSDSVRSLTHPIPLDQVAGLARSSISFPALAPQLWRADVPG